ncbi:MAG: cytochrome c biogenesis protein CcdA [Firmicutes bacterium]|nr:cytochrome c biogenesis protein CcdA [Bacillota bacterium]HOB34440.1 cytochrome c biogenesis CcdA family protein [Bacillota bacterium]HPZ89820.1 cytochrome c biogenesis CcdA family protein [Bacillota bacterium]HQE01164.1 cytochrome c biogenesis CcdA family protein [Bacillota bacterium]
MSIPVAFAAGVAAFFSPCVLPLLPVWLAFLSGSRAESKGSLAVNLLFFAAGFAVVFTAMGATATALGTWLGANRTLLSRVGGAVLLIFGLQMTGWWQVPLLQRKLGISFRPRQSRAGYFLFGVVLALGWTPCVGIWLASILMLAGSQETVWQGMLLLFVFSLGFALPFFAAGLFIDAVALGKVSRRISRALQWGAGLVLIVMGLLLIFNRWHWIQNFFT